MTATRRTTRRGKPLRLRATRGLCPVRKTALFVHILYKNDHFAETGSGQTGKALKKVPFSAGPRCDALNSHGNDLLDPMMISGRAFPPVLVVLEYNIGTIYRRNHSDMCHK